MNTRKVRVGDVFAPVNGETLIVVVRVWHTINRNQRLNVICNQIDAARSVHGRAKLRGSFPPPAQPEYPRGWYYLNGVRLDDIRRGPGNRYQCAEAAVALNGIVMVNDPETERPMTQEAARSVLSVHEWWTSL